MRFRLGARRVILAAALGMALASAVTACSSSSSSASTSSAPSSSALASSASASSAGLMLGTGLLALLALRSRPLTGEEHDQDSPNG